MGSSKYRLPMRLEQRTNVKDDRGGVTPTWTQVGVNDIFVKVTAKPLVGLGQIGGTLVSAVRHQVQMRYRNGVVPGMRLNNFTYGKVLYIQDAYDATGEQIELTCECTEVE